MHNPIIIESWCFIDIFYCYSSSFEISCLNKLRSIFADKILFLTNNWFFLLTMQMAKKIGACGHDMCYFMSKKMAGRIVL
jgi:hypothetical protein